MLSKIGKNFNIQFEAVHAPSQYVNDVWIGNEYGDKYRQNIENIIDLCSDGEVGKLVVHVGTSISVPITEKGLFSWSALEQYAKKRNVHICYENSNAPDHFKAVVENSDTYHGICHDIGHQNCYTPEVNYLRLFGSRILYTHIHDNFGVQKKGEPCDLHLIPCDGSIDWTLYFSDLREAGYNGTLNLELSCFHFEQYRNMSFKQFVETSYRRITNLVF